MSDPVKVILVGDDGSAGGANAIAFAARLAAPLGAEAVLVEAYSPLEQLGKAKPPVDFPALKARAQERLETERAAVLREHDVAYRVELIEDPDAIGVLARTAKQVGADLVVVGSHGHTGWRARIMGNVATKLPHELECPIAIVPAPRS